MTFTALHRAAGAEPGKLSDAILDAAIAMNAREADDLDWKEQLPDEKALKTSDFPKDVAAMANSGGGMIVYGVVEEDKAATERIDESKCDEGYERTLRAVACSAIMPPVFNLGVCILVSPKGLRAVVVEVPGSVEVPHLVEHRKQRGFYGSPRRNDADTHWMTERELESMYRLRFEERRHSTETLDALHADASAGRDTAERVWLIGVAHPRIPQLRERLSEEAARGVIAGAMNVGGGFTEMRRPLGPDGSIRAGHPRGQHPLEAVSVFRLRPGLRRWVAPPKHEDWREAWLSVHHDGSVTLAAAVGGQRTQSDSHETWEVTSWAIEAAIADFMALVLATATQTSNDEYDLRIACKWDGAETMTFRQNDAHGNTWKQDERPVHHFTPVETSLRARQPMREFQHRVFEVARDCLNQGGLSDPNLIDDPQPDSS